MTQLIALLGVLAAIGSFMTDTAPSGTHNVGLLQQQMMVLHTGLAMVIVSAILSLKGASASDSSPSSVSEAEVIGADRSDAQRKGWLIALVIAVLAFAGIIMSARP